MDTSELTAADWNSGRCDLFAAALARRYGLPMLGAFERLAGGRLGDLYHAFCVLPDGRHIDAAGPCAPFVAADCSSEGKDVVGVAIVPTGPEDPHLASLNRYDYDLDMAAMGVMEWIDAHLGATLEALGCRPVAIEVAAPVP